MTETEHEHEHDVGEVLEKIDTSEWKITNRMVDVDTGEVLYRLREVGENLTHHETEVLSESQVDRSFVRSVEAGGPA